MLRNLALGLLAAQSVTATHFVMYIDEWHKAGLPGADKTQDIDYAIMSFATSESLNSGSSYTPFEATDTMRKRFSPNTKLMVAVGGWGDEAGFSTAAKDDASRKKYAKNIADMLDATGFDGVDIDWEYPGGNGQDYKQVPNSSKVSEIETYPKFLAAVREAIGNKTLSIAVPARKQDMIAFNNQTGPEIAKSVDMVNVMSYDMINRRDTVTAHHTSVQGSLDVINDYLDFGFQAEQLNLGFAYYAKWFTTDPNSDCATKPLGCKLVKLEEDDGSDNGKSGAVTFEPSPEGVPSNVAASWKRAQKDGKADDEAGGQYYFDADENIFWTWDTPEFIAKKYTEIVGPKKLGGVMAWSLGEDTDGFTHLQAMQNGLKTAGTKKNGAAKKDSKN